MSEAERRFGVAPVPDATVTYQPDVIIVGGGAAAIRSQDPNGFRWTIDAGAPHARDLVPGKVFFMTGRAVGRVLDVRLGEVAIDAQGVERTGDQGDGEDAHPMPATGAMEDVEGVERADLDRDPARLAAIESKENRTCPS